MRAFISYSHHDVAALERLHVHLAALRRDDRIQTWFDRDILAGDQIDIEISRELENADIFLLLISPDFIASDYCMEREMLRALERHDAGEARVVPIIVESCDWASVQSLRRLKALPKDGKPISEWANSNTAFLGVVQELRRILDAEEPHPALTSTPVNLLDTSTSTLPRYRVQRTFDEIDRAQFREAAFAVIKDYFRRAISEINAIDGLRGRFAERGAMSFGGTVVNRGRQLGTAHITVHCRRSNFGLSDIFYSFSENSPENTANGGFSVSFDEYEQFLTASMSPFQNETERLSSDQAAEKLWKKFIEQAGITYA